MDRMPTSRQTPPQAFGTAALPDPDRDSAAYDGVPAKRAIAWIIDTLLVTAVVALITLFTAFTALFVLPILWLSVGFLYRWVGISRRSATIGMRLLGIEFRDRDGAPFDGAMAFVHTLGYSLSMAFVLPQVVSVGLMLLSRRGQGLTDHILGSVAINRMHRA